MSSRPTSSAPDALAQRGFERRLPAGLDVDARPQALQAVEAVLGEPGLELAFGLHLFLQRAQRIEARAQVGLPGAFGVDGVLLRAARIVERRHLFVELAQARVGAVRSPRFFGGVELPLQVGQALGVGRGELAFARRPGGRAPRVELAALVLDAAALGGEHLDLLLHRGDLAALLVAEVLRGPHRVFEARQVARVLLGLRGEHLALLVGRSNLLGDLL